MRQKGTVMDTLSDTFVKKLNKGWNGLLWSAFPFGLAGVVYHTLDNGSGVITLMFFLYAMTVMMSGLIVEGLKKRYFSLGRQQSFRHKNPISYWVLIVCAFFITAACLIGAVALTISGYD